MQIERVKNAGRNVVFGGCLKVYQIVVPFLMRTAMIYFMGVEYLGINSLFASILQVLNLTELGVGSAMVYSMYKPIAEDDTQTICALMRLYRFYYRIIGMVVAVIGIVLTPFIPYLVKNDLPSGLNIYILYLLNLASTVLSYWLFAYKNALFQAHQRNDIISKIILMTNTLQYIIQLSVIIFIKDYYLYLLAALLTQALTNIVTAIAAEKKYPEYKPRGKLEKDIVKDINQRIRDLFTSKIGVVVVNYADTIVISAFLGLTMLAIYQNYFFILNAVIGFVTIIFQSCTAGIGNSVITETKEKNFNDLKKFTFLIFWIAGFCTCCLLGLYQPFMEIWVGEELMLGLPAVILFCLYYFIYEINQLLNTYKDSAGIWHKDRFRPLITAGANLLMNLIMVHIWGIYGVLLSTVLSTIFVGMPWVLHNLFTTVFEKRFFYDYIIELLKYAGIALASCILVFLSCHFISLGKWETLLVRAVICCILPNVFYFIVYRKKEEFRQCIYLIDKITKKQFKLSRFL